MKFKIDENLGPAAALALQQAGYDALTVVDQDLCSASDEQVIRICQQEQRCLLTLDLDFANPFRFPPSLYSGIVVLRLPYPATSTALQESLQTLLRGLVKNSPLGTLWVVRKDSIRAYHPPAR